MAPLCDTLHGLQQEVVIDREEGRHLRHLVFELIQIECRPMSGHLRVEHGGGLGEETCQKQDDVVLPWH